MLPQSTSSELASKIIWVVTICHWQLQQALGKFSLWRQPPYSPALSIYIILHSALKYGKWGKNLRKWVWHCNTLKAKIYFLMMGSLYSELDFWLPPQSVWKLVNPFLLVTSTTHHPDNYRFSIQSVVNQSFIALFSHFLVQCALSILLLYSYSSIITTHQKYIEQTFLRQLSLHLDCSGLNKKFQKRIGLQRWDSNLKCLSTWKSAQN